MATLVSAQAAAGYPVHRPQAGVVVGAMGHYTFLTAPTTADVVHMLKLPDGAQVVGGFLQANDIDSNATEEVDLDIGTTDDPDMFGNMGVLPGDAITNLLTTAQIYLPFQGLLTTVAGTGPQTMSGETTLMVTVVASAATFVASSFLTLVAWYQMPMATTA